MLMDEDRLLTKEIQVQFGLPAVIDNRDELATALAVAINQMIIHNRDRLIQLLYRMDISEKKLKTLLQEHPQTDAGQIIAALVIEREQQKLASRAANKLKGNEATDVEGTERW